MDLTFRPARAADLPGIVRLLVDDELGRERDDAGMPLDARYLEAFAAIDRDPNQMLTVVERGGELVGCLQITFIPGLSRFGMWRGQIESVRIASSERGRGLGRTMMEWALAECRKRNCGIVQLTTDKRRHRSHRFYESLGFEASHEGMKHRLSQ